VDLVVELANPIADRVDFVLRRVQPHGDDHASLLKNENTHSFEWVGLLRTSLRQPNATRLDQAVKYQYLNRNEMTGQENMKD